MLVYIFKFIHTAKRPKIFHLESRIIHSYVRTEMKMASEGKWKEHKIENRETWILVTVHINWAGGLGPVTWLGLNILPCVTSGGR